MIFVAGLATVVLVSSCKERGEVERESLSVAGYEVTYEAFFRASESDDIRAMKTMLESGLALDSVDKKSRTALHAAAGSGAMQSINFMLDRRMDVNVTDADGRTPLMEAVLRSTPETVRYLLRQGADPLLKDNERFSPLMLAVRDGRRNMVPELAPYVRDSLDDALLAASILGQAGVIDELTNFGASIYARYDDGRTPLMLAAQRGHTEAVELLLEIGANRFAMSQEGKTAAEMATDAGYGLLATRLAKEPEEGDFELTEPVELGAEMAAMVEERVAQAELIAESADQGAMGDELASASDDGDGTDVFMEEAGQAPVSLEGAVLESEMTEVSETSLVGVGPANETVSAPIIMRSYRQRELPLQVESAEKGVASIRLPGEETRKIGEGSTIPGTSLKVIRVHRKMQSGKENSGEPIEVSVVEVEDTNSGVSRDLVAELPALAHDPVALVQDSKSGRYYVARTGQRFQAADGTDYLVGDVRPNQVVIENMTTHETTTIPLRGPRG
ncbi:ankyrin repeat domain-containing protein [Haloferula sp.]|uniref:ankyrin repeat domain-containing protein n=1 Tax=Haloferula sp. TaxID=2497595 RepID=UPI00329D6266